jgi:hypothetical protein
MLHSAEDQLKSIMGNKEINNYRYNKNDKYYSILLDCDPD